MPPSKIAGTWSPEEIRQAEALARLEGWGQEKRRTASILAEMHNISLTEQWLRACAVNEQPPPKPKMLTASDFLPSRVERKADPIKTEVKKEQVMQKLTGIMNSLCGY